MDIIYLERGYNNNHYPYVLCVHVTSLCYIRIHTHIPYKHTDTRIECVYIRIHTHISKLLHTSTDTCMHRVLLEDKGFTLGKIMILLGGPDWPTAVLAGILQQSLFSMTIGSLPQLIPVGVWPTNCVCMYEPLYVCMNLCMYVWIFVCMYESQTRASSL